MITINNIYQTLLSYYGYQNWWPAKSTYEMLIGAILTQNTNWQNVEKAFAHLGNSLNPNDILKIELSELAEKIRPSGYYNQKAERLKIFTRWYQQYHFDPKEVELVPANDLRKELLNIKGIGRETADCMLVYAFNKPFFVIDAYTRRLFERLGYQVPKNYDDFRLLIESNISKSVPLFNEFHALIVKHNKIHCLAKSNCIDCPLNRDCLFYEKSYDNSYGDSYKDNYKFDDKNQI